MGRANMSSLLMSLPTILPSTHTQPLYAPSLPLSSLSSSENRRELGFGLDELVAGLIQMNSILQPGVGVKKVECQSFFFSYLFFHSLFPHICPTFLSVFFFLFSHPSFWATSKQRKLHLSSTFLFVYGEKS